MPALRDACSQRDVSIHKLKGDIAALEEGQAVEAASRRRQRALCWALAGGALLGWLLLGLALLLRR